MTIRETSFREKTIRESNHEGNDRIPKVHSVGYNGIRSFPGWSFSRIGIGRFLERRFPDGHFPGKSFPGWSFSWLRRFGSSARPAQQLQRPSHSVGLTLRQLQRRLLWLLSFATGTAQLLELSSTHTVSR